MSRKIPAIDVQWSTSQVDEVANTVRGGRALAMASAVARERAVTWLVEQQLDRRRAADGRCVGIQAALATGPEGEQPIDLYDLLDGHLAASDPRNEADPWLAIVDQIRDKLGFPLEPELFSNMVFAAYLGDAEHPALQRIARALLATFCHGDAAGLYHFFTSLRFACDTDCTGMALRARLACGELDPSDARGAAALRRSTAAILRSAAIDELAAADNRSYGKLNGALRRHVIKVYLDDHEVQGRITDRGRKNNPAVVANALYPVLCELECGRRRPDERIALREFVETSEAPIVAEATVASIVRASLAYVADFVHAGQWREGCRYYALPDAPLCFIAELAARHPVIDDAHGLRPALRAAVIERRTHARGPFGPERPLSAALRAITAANVGLDPQPELEQLLATQDASGAWLGFDCLYTLGTTSSRLPVHFGSAALTTALAVRALGRRPPTASDARWWRALVEAQG